MNMKHTLVSLVALSLAASACSGESETESAQLLLDEAAPAVLRNISYHQHVRKYCDEGRAIYFIAGNDTAAMAVVEDANECA
jgi:hypothetical protein